MRASSSARRRIAAALRSPMRRSQVLFVAFALQNNAHISAVEATVPLPSFVDQLKDADVFVGETIKLGCKVDNKGQDMPKIVWSVLTIAFPMRICNTGSAATQSLQRIYARQ